MVLIQGPRSVGKSTLLSRLAEQCGGRIIDLDRPGLRNQVADDPEYFVGGEGPVLVDEYQLAFEIKASGRVTDAALRPLRKLRDAAGEAFAGGVAFYLGEHSTSTRDGLLVLPVDRLWD